MSWDREKDDVRHIIRNELRRALETPEERAERERRNRRQFFWILKWFLPIFVLITLALPRVMESYFEGKYLPFSTSEFFWIGAAIITILVNTYLATRQLEIGGTFILGIVTLAILLIPGVLFFYGSDATEEKQKLSSETKETYCQQACGADKLLEERYNSTEAYCVCDQGSGIRPRTITSYY